MAEVRDQMLAALAARYDNPHELASEHFDNLLFGEKNPDGWVLTPEDVQKITRARAGGVLEDLLPPQQRASSPSRATSIRRACAPSWRRRSAPGHEGRRAGAPGLQDGRRSQATRILWSTSPT